MKPWTLPMLVSLFVVSCTKTLNTPSGAVPPETKHPVEVLDEHIFFISATGDSLNHGHSPEKPWDLATANRYTFQPGDIIEIIEQVEGTLTLNESGSANQPITIKGGTITNKSGHGLVLYNCDHIIVRNLQIRGSGQFNSNPTDAGIYLLSDDRQRHGNITIDEVVVKGFGLAGIYSELAMSPNTKWESEAASMAYPGGFDNLTVNRCVTDSNGFTGIQIGGSWPGKQNRNIVIKNTIASYNRGIKGMQPHTGNGIIITNTSNGLIDSCTASYNGWEYGHANVGIWTYTSDNITIQRSIAFRNQSKSSADGDGFDIDGGTSNCVMQYNLAYENDGAGFLAYEFGDPNGMKNNAIRYNISYNDARKNKQYGGITYGGQVAQENLYLYNNTIVKPEGKAITRIGYEVKGLLDIRNNILSAPEQSALSTSASNNLSGIVKLGDQFFPLAGSKAIDAAEEIKGLPSTDFYGTPIRGIRDIGAVEYKPD
ncbi:right-handed parallel beta-helix repeat-containing protein [Flavihumibacter rivuli]|uniref:right-handed parallel beta-helix repeat-containing protein n=1 Tax=Flavihumibacter rivuli TaxID=2838156 RepID=UPI001BDF6C7F|nr:right-handed parallel beta-helix repeat-containing protein [Flavihumibacter rivuli]ULQ56273.1 right-handed parallel beta-helix repeat-containing protein [Flavihumibacter rivuli]